MSSLYEKVRPRCWAEVIGQPEAVDMLTDLAARKAIGGSAYFIKGKSGTGKTSIARLIAAEIAEPLCIEEMGARQLTIGALNDIRRSLHFRGWGEKGGKAFIINEAQGLSKAVIEELLITLEVIPDWACWVFTTTIEGAEHLFEEYADSSPLLSRCKLVPMAQRDLAKAFAQRAKEIAEAEGLDGQSIDKYVRLVNDNRANFRAVLQAIESGYMKKR